MRIQGLGGDGEKRSQEKKREDKTREEKRKGYLIPAYLHMNQHRLHPPRYIFPTNIGAISIEHGGG